jgi:hypothetical protein
VSLLWPETIYIGLFPGHCWLQRNSMKTEYVYEPQLSSDPRSLLQTLAMMLDEHAHTLRKGSRISIIVSDSIGRISTLDWQEQLRSPEELSAYAQVCFENQGVEIESHWVMRTEFTRHKAMGIAYALPHDWLDELIEIISACGLRLARVLPISAAAYCKEYGTSKTAQNIVLIRERYRISALIYRGLGLVSYDVEPITKASEVSCLRLIRRLSSAHQEIDAISVWSVEGHDQSQFTDIIANCLPEATLHSYDLNVWH